MNRSNLLQGSFAGLLLVTATGCSALGIRTVEEASHSVLRQDDSFEIRQYDQLVAVETSVEAAYDQASGVAFQRLFDYISGENRERSEIAMTAPVLVEPQSTAEGVEVAMTAPVLTEGSERSWRVAFVLPAKFTPATAPLPANPLVELSTIPPKLVAAIRFSGRLTETELREREQELRQWIDRSGFVPTSKARSAGYDPPWTPAPLRRNEVLIDVERKS